MNYISIKLLPKRKIGRREGSKEGRRKRGVGGREERRKEEEKCNCSCSRLVDKDGLCLQSSGLRLAAPAAPAHHQPANWRIHKLDPHKIADF